MRSATNTLLAIAFACGPGRSLSATDVDGSESTSSTDPSSSSEGSEGEPEEESSEAETGCSELLMTGRLLAAETHEPVETSGTLFGPYTPDADLHFGLFTDPYGEFEVPSSYMLEGEVGVEFARHLPEDEVRLLAHERFILSACEQLDVGDLYIHRSELSVPWVEGDELELVIAPSLTLRVPSQGVNKPFQDGVILGGKSLAEGEFMSSVYPQGETPVAQFLLGSARTEAELDPFLLELSGDFDQAPGTLLRAYQYDYFMGAPELLGEFEASPSALVTLETHVLENLHIVRPN